jgi:hypothetical protein
MPDYSKGKIYTIRCRTDATLIYVGSTIQPLAKRWGLHKCYSLKQPETLIYKTMNNDWGNWYIELYELFPCNSKEELLKKEGEIIRLIGNLNSKIAGRTIKEYRDENEVKLKDKTKKWRQNNKQEIKDYNKIYYENNKEKYKNIKKEWYEINKIKITCSCGGCYIFQNKLKHLKTKKHNNFLPTLGGE